jgi:transcriptional regulator with XRE-family HTH domain
MLVASSTFGKRLKELREQAALSQYALAKKSGLTAQTIANVEGGSEPTWPTVLRLARALDVSVEDFDTGEDPRDADQGDEDPPAPPVKKRKPRKPRK